MRDYWGVGKALKEMLPLIAVPTTAGTGSEMQSFALISDAESHVKMACGDKKAACRIALLDPELTVTQPRRVTALTGIDAIAHAVETFVTTKRNAASLAFSREAWLLLASNFARVLESPTDLEARAGMQLGASFAGLAIENSMLGAAHACANPLTAQFNITHGVAVATMLPHVVRFNGAAANGEYAALTDEEGRAADSIAAQVERFSAAGELPPRLRDHGVPSDALAALAADAATQWTGGFNPRPVSEGDFVKLYEAAW
jgi:alcohol dehydrogenase